MAKVPDFKWEWIESEPTMVELKAPESKKLSKALDKAVNASMLAMWNKNVIQASEAVQAMATTVNETSTSLHSVLVPYIETDEQARKRQEAVDAKWRPWFESLTAWQNEVLARTQSHRLMDHVSPDYTRVVSFPENHSESDWYYFQYVVNDPRYNVIVMLERVPSLQAVLDPDVCPVTGCQSGSGGKICNYIMHLNDEHNYKFTDIADWLDSLGIDFSFPID